MKLISCYIDNFGGLSGFSLDFQEGLTVVRQPNGFGKTTLAEFIRAMFYGFPRKNRKSLSRREKYRPWNGRPCRGNLTFEHEGVRYRIERSFGAVPKGDTCKIYDLTTGQETTRFLPEIGEALFGLDAESFERSTYLPQSRDSGPLTTDSIRAKLGNLVEDTGDMGNYEKAVEALRASRSACQPFKGRGGAVAADMDQIIRVQQELDAAEECARGQIRAAAELQALEGEHARLTAQIDTVRRELTDANEAALRQTHRLRYEELTDSLNGVNAALAELEARYPRGLPDAAALDAAESALLRLARLEEQAADTEEELRARRFVAEHQERFAGGIPDSGEFDRIYQIRDRRRETEIRLDSAVMSGEETAELEALHAFFTPGLPDEAALDRFEADLQEAARLRGDNLRLASSTVQMPRYKLPSPLTVPLLLGCGLAAVLAGVWLLAGSRTVPGILALAAAVLVLAGAGWLHRRGCATRSVPALSPQIQNMVRENEARAAALEAAVHAFTAAYGGAAPAKIRQRMARLTALSRRDADLAKIRRELSDRLAQCDQTLGAFFARYRCPGDGDVRENLNRFQRLCDNWQRAVRQLEACEQRQTRARRETEQVRQILADFRTAFGVPLESREQAAAIREDIRQNTALTAAGQDLEARIARYRREHGVTLAEPVPDPQADPAALRRREAELLERHSGIGERLLRLRQQTRQLRETAGQIPGLRDELAHWQAQKELHEKNARLLDDTIAFLTQARDDLSKTYMGPIREGFIALMGRMAGEDPGKILMTRDLEVQLEREGASRPLGYFSAGQSDVVMLCMRLALVDALFREARPFVILDDPFVNLDDTHTREALALLRELSRDRQIIYLVCHSSRVS